MKETKNTIHTFWTGGMDSTFTLIQLLKNTSAPVQPHYIVRHEESTGLEIDAMITIRRTIVRRYPELRPRFLPTIYVNEDLIPRFKEIDDEIEELRKIGKVREQYQIMSHYCKAFDIEKIDVAFTNASLKSLKESGLYEPFMNSAAFSYFTYSMIALSKEDSFKLAKENGWEDILLMTSFCRRPVKKVSPCGVCGPCIDAVDSGIGFRFSIKSYAKARLQMPFRKYWRRNYDKQNTSWFFKMIKRRYEGKL